MGKRLQWKNSTVLLFYVEKDNRLGVTKKDTKAFIEENVL